MGMYYERGGVCPDNTTQPARPVTRISLGLRNCGLIHAYYLSVSFSYLRSAAGVSFDIKKACRKPYTLHLLSGSVRHVTGNDKDYLRKIPRVVW